MTQLIYSAHFNCIFLVFFLDITTFDCLFNSDALTPADMQIGCDDDKDGPLNGNSSSINSIVNPTINANKSNGHIKSTMMMSHMI